MDTVSNPGAGIGCEIATGDRGDAQIDSFISKRHERRVKDEGERQVEELWKARERFEVARRRAELDDEWRGWHRSRAALYRRRAAEHDAAAERREGAA